MKAGGVRRYTQKHAGDRLTKRIWSFLESLAIAMSWELWLKRSDVMDVVRLPSDFIGFGLSPIKDPPS